MINPKIWLIGITQNAKQDIDEMTKDIMPYINGLVFVDSFSNDGTKELLEERKKEGEIISLPWMNNHGFSMQACLNSEKIQPNDYCILLDTSERLSLSFAQNLKEFIKLLAIRNINTVYHYSKVVIFKYNTNLLFIGTPHWGLHGVQDHKIRLEDTFPNTKDCVYSVRNDRRPKSHFVNHFLKYYLYKISNHLLLGRENNHQEFQIHEEIRIKFRLYCINELNINPLNLKNLIDYWKTNELNYQMKWFIEYERILNDAYCFNVLSHSVDDILERHKTNELWKLN